MAGIAGIAKENSYDEVSAMLDMIAHRGRNHREIVRAEGTTIGVCWNEPATSPVRISGEKVSVSDMAGPGHFASVTAQNGEFIFSRDRVGEAPLYSGSCADGTKVFASEVKALAPEIRNLTEVSPGCGEGTDNTQHPESGTKCHEVPEDPDRLALYLRELLDETLSRILRTEKTGAWLSGGLDSAAVTALASRNIGRINTFTAGLEGAPDLDYASYAAKCLGTVHHEIIVGVNDLKSMLPDVIWHLESFDPLLVRSSLLNFAAARKAADYVSDILSGEGADEFFAGYTYLTGLPLNTVNEELLRLTGKLHNTALQRVDRCAAAFGLTPRLIFTHPAVRELALAVPADLKIKDGEGKWILRKAMEEILPPDIAWRQKAKFWEGGGVNERLSEIADASISDSDFINERVLPNGWTLHSKEELLYYRIFRDFFGSDISLSWMGRTDTGTVAA